MTTAVRVGILDNIHSVNHRNIETFLYLTNYFLQAVSYNTVSESEYTKTATVSFWICAVSQQYQIMQFQKRRMMATTTTLQMLDN